MTERKFIIDGSMPEHATADQCCKVGALPNCRTENDNNGSGQQGDFRTMITWLQILKVDFNN